MKNARLQFAQGEQKKFIEQVYKMSNLTTKELAALASVHTRSFTDWKREKLRMSASAAEIYCRQFNLQLPEKKDLLINRWKNAQKAAARIGGTNRYKLYGNFATHEGRRKGGQKAIRILREKGMIPVMKQYVFPPACEELAEFCGILLGDGGITKEQCFITLNREADHEYIQFVSLLAENLFKEKPKVYQHKHDKAVVLYYNGISFIQFLISIGLKTGNKVRQQVGVPDWILSSPTYKKACLRGLMDTDGGVFLHKYVVNNKTYYYKKINFTNRSMPLLQFAMNTLIELEFTPKIIDKVENKKVWLYNGQEVERYLTVIGTHNPRLLKNQQLERSHSGLVRRSANALS